MPTSTVHLIDASPYIFRAWFALPALKDPRGRPVSAVRGFASFLLDYLAQERPTHIACAFDESLTTSFRNELYPPYKAQRELPPPELVEQLEGCRRMSEALAVPAFASTRFEADDLIASLLHGLEGSRFRAVIISPDKDLAQLVGPRVELFDYARSRRYGPAEVRERFGVEPRQIPDYLGLAGDTVDNIPGVRGIGAKGAAALLTALGDLDTIYADLEAVAALPLRGARGMAKKLEADRESAFLSRELATVARDAPCAASLEELAWAGVPEDAAELFGEYGLEKVWERGLAKLG